MTTRAALVAIVLSSITSLATASDARQGRGELPAAAFEVCHARPVGSSCSVDDAQGICAAASTPGEAFCFHAPEAHLASLASPRPHVQTSISRNGFPLTAFAACSGRGVGASCGTDGHGLCVQSSNPDRTFCFVSPTPALGHGVLMSANLRTSER